jgi:membrane protease YdiL (CAAX protease family)
VFEFANNAIIAVSEEVVWRGCVQTRLVAMSGPLSGLSITCVFFALLHFPQRCLLYSGVIPEAPMSALLVAAVGLLFGYEMLKTQNIIVSSTVHLFANWSALFWRISSF